MPILTAADICKGVSERRSRHSKALCLVRWSRETFPWNAACREAAQKNMRYVIEEELGYVLDLPAMAGSIAVFNDRQRVTRATLARVWNRAMFLLGYTRGNPEKKPLSRQKGK